MTALILKNIIFNWKKFLITAILAGLIVFAAAGSIIFTASIRELAGKPLASLQTELILQKDTADKNPAKIKTRGIILPFSLDAFSKAEFENKINGLENVKAVSTALVLWQFDVKDNRTIVGLNVNDPKVGLRDIESMLMPGSGFFSSNSAAEVILERHFSKLFGYQLGGNYPIGRTQYKIVGLVDFRKDSNLANAQIFMPYETALQAVGSQDEIVNQAFLSLKSAAELNATENTLIKDFPGFSVLNKDSLFKNLSALNRLFYRFGAYFELAMVLIALVLLFFIVKLRRLEYKHQTGILRTLGWSKFKILRWVLIDTLVFSTSALVVGGVLASILWWQIPALIHISPLINYSMSL